LQQKKVSIYWTSFQLWKDHFKWMSSWQCFYDCIQEASETLETHFELADTVYTSAVVQPVEEVYLWLGVSKISFMLVIFFDLLADFGHYVTRFGETRQILCSHTHYQRLGNC
jgi:hypothetical protein